MTNNGKIEIPQEDISRENFVHEENGEQIALSNPQENITSVQPTILRDDLINYEKERQCLFRVAFCVTILVILGLYAGLGWWICSQGSGYHIHENMWHIAVILAIPPTTLLFLLLKVLARQQATESSTNYSPLAEFGTQLLNVLREFFSKK